MLRKSVQNSLRMLSEFVPNSVRVKLYNCKNMNRMQFSLNTKIPQFFGSEKVQIFLRISEGMFMKFPYTFLSEFVTNSARIFVRVPNFVQNFLTSEIGGTFGLLGTYEKPPVLTLQATGNAINGEFNMGMS